MIIYSQNKLSFIVKNILKTAALAGCLSFTAYGAEYDISANQEFIGPVGVNTSIKSEGKYKVTFKGDSGKQFSLSAVGGKSEIVGTKLDIVLAGAWGGDGSVFYTNGKDASIDINVNSIVTEGEVKGSMPFHAMGGDISVVAADKIEINGAGNAVFAQKNGEGVESSISLKAKDIYLTSNTGVTVAAASLNSKDAGKKSIVTISSENLLSIESKGTAVSAYGQDWQSGEAVSNSNEVSLSGKTVIISGQTAINAKNGIDQNNRASVTVKGETINITGAIKANKNAQINIGDTDTKQAIIYGDVTSIDGSFVDINLGTEGLLQGCISTSDSSLSGSGVFLNLGQGSVWEVTGESKVSQISGEGSIVITDKQNTVTVTSLDGQLSAGFKGLTSDDFTQKELSEMVQVSKLSDESSLTIAVEEGDIKGAMTVIQTNGGSTYTETENTKLSSFSSVNVTNLLQWRHEMNDLTKRMGELRISPEGVGAWARLYGSEQEYGNTGTETKNTSVQVGADYDVGAGWKVGAAFSYTDSSSSMNNGSADGDMFGLAVYGAWFNDDGQFLDLIAKYSRLSTDFTAGNMSGSYDNNAFSVSAEYGWHFKFNDLAFVEPQAELTYGQVLGDDFTTGNQVRIEQDDVDSLIGRLGVRGGFYFPENKGTIYARASVLHDFDGESSFTATKGESATYTEDMGGTWYEFGIGANFNLTDTTYTYVDLEKSTGGEVKENWRWNVGLRHVW